MTPPPPRSRRLPLTALLILILPFALLLLAETVRRTGLYSQPVPKAVALMPQPRPLDFLGTPPPSVWHLIVHINAPCGEPCLVQLRQLHGFRVALGRRSGNLRLAGLQHGLSQQQINQLQQKFPGLRVYPLRAQMEDILPDNMLSAAAGQGAVGMADASPHLIATFPPDAEPKAVLSDIRRLMR